ncbi:MAG: glutamyl-tRNA reductase [Chitinophagales bacterium]
MKAENTYSIKDFKVLGISHWNTPVAVREKYSLNESLIHEIKAFAKEQGIDNLLLLSTCNRSEVFAFTDSFEKLAAVFLHFGKGELSELQANSYQKSGEAAIRHLFEVANGLDSQILGDFQIVSQLKNAYQSGMENGLINTELSRLVEQVIQCSKKVKRKTQLSSGAASTAYAAVQHIKKHNSKLDNNEVLLIGTGKIGRVTCKNLVKHLDHNHIRIINRTQSTAEELAETYGLQCGNFDDMEKEIAKAGIIVVATGAPVSVILPEHLDGITEKKIILDLSVPRNVHPDIDQINNVEVIDMDHLEDTKSESLAEREASIPKAKAIIDTFIETYSEWLDMRSIAPTIQALKLKLKNIKEQEIQKELAGSGELDSVRLDAVSDRIINNITKQCVLHLKKNYKNETLSVQAIQQIFDLETELQS